MKRVSAYITDDMYEELRQLAFRNNISHSEAIKLALQNLFASESKMDEEFSAIRYRNNIYKCQTLAYQEYGFPLSDVDKCGNDIIPDLGCKGCPARDENRNIIEGWKTR